MKQTERFITDDICFCMSDCTNTKCRRHKTNILRPDIPHSFSDFSAKCGRYKAEKKIKMIQGNDKYAQKCDPNELYERVEVSENNMDRIFGTN